MARSLPHPESDMNLITPFRIALRELKGGVKNFQILVVCLTLGVASVSAVGLVQSGIEQSLQEQGATILGGDIELEFAYRYADQNEKQWMVENATSISEIVEFRSMAVANKEGTADRALTQIKAVDDLYPLYGELRLDNDLLPKDAFKPVNGIPGAIMRKALVERLGLTIGSEFRLGFNTFRLSGVILQEPDETGGNFSLGPRTMVLLEDLTNSGLIDDGTLFSSRYRLTVPVNVDMDALRNNAETVLGSTFSWRDKRNGSPGIQAVVERVGAFLTLVGLAGLIVGGIGISLTVSTYLETKTKVIATLKTLGAEQMTIFLIYLIQVVVLIAIGIFFGLILGVLIPFLLESILSDLLPVPFAFEIHLVDLLESAFYGLLIGLIFSIWALAKTCDIKPGALYRDANINPWKIRIVPYGIVLIILIGVFIASASVFSGIPRLTLYISGGIIGTLIALGLIAQASRYLSFQMGHSKFARGKIALGLALRSIGESGNGVISLTLALGLGLSVLASIGQISNNLLRNITGDIPQVAPTFFVIDIQNQDLPQFRELVMEFPSVTNIESAPMLRGIITEINGIPSREISGDHWVLEGDRGITYSDTLPENTIITEGIWWEEDYAGPPLVSFAEEEGKELGLKLGDDITLNILGRNIEAEIVNFRSVDFSSVGLGFILSMNPAALAGAPHSHIATIYTEDNAEEELFERITSAYPSITVISVSEGIANVSRIISSLGSAIIYASSITLVLGFVVLLGAAASSVAARVYESAILKVLGATRRTLMFSLALRSIILGISASLVAFFAGITGGWAVMNFVLEASFRIEPLSGFLIVFGGALLSLLASLFYFSQPLNSKPSAILYNRD